MTLHRKVLLIGIDGLGLDLLHSAIDAGLMPAIDSLVCQGASGRLVAGVSTDSAVCWTTLATGCRPDRHRILDGMVFDPLSGGLRPVDGFVRKSHAIWNLATREDRKSVVVGWPASHPADPIEGGFVSDRFFDQPLQLQEQWPVSERSVYPPYLEESLAELRLHVGELSGEDIAPFVPKFEAIDQKRDGRLGLIASSVAETVSYHAVATHLLGSIPWSLALIRYPILDRLADTFLKFRNPLLDGVDHEEASIYGQVMDSSLRLVDNMVSYLLSMSSDADVLICSPFGIQSIDGPVNQASQERSSAPGVLRHEHGCIVISGSGVVADGLVHGAALVDVVPTILARMGLPLGADFPGRVLSEAFTSSPSFTTIPSWESLDGTFGRLDPQQNIGLQDDASDLLGQLMSLGYSAHDPHALMTESNQRLKEDHTLAITHMRAMEWEQAVPLLERVLAARPLDGSVHVLLAWCYLNCGDADRCNSLAQRALLLEGSVGHGQLLLATLAMLDSRREAAIEHLKQAEKTSEHGLSEKIAHVNLMLGRYSESDRFVALALRENPNSAVALYLRAVSLLEQHKNQAAADSALQATGRSFYFPEAHAVLGVALARLGRFPESITALERSVGQRPSVLAHATLARIFEKVLGDTAAAEEHQQAAETLGCGLKKRQNEEKQ